MTASYNLLTEPWIPCVLTTGERVEFGLRETFRRAGVIATIPHASPLVEVAVFRLLLVILHRVANGPRSMEDWKRLWTGRSFDEAALDAYFDRWASRFDLFDSEYPFMQVGGLALIDGTGAESPPDTPARLVIERASGNNATLFDHAFDDVPEAMPSASAALHLLAAQTWALGGGKGPSSNRFGEHPYASHAPMVGRVHVRVQRANLFETLVANATGLLPGGATATPGDQPVWERDEHRQPGVRRPDGLLDLLTFPARAVRLHPNATGAMVTGVVSAPGLKVVDKDTDWQPQWDPAVATRATKEGIRTVYLSESRATWRDVGALLAITHADGQHDGRPGVIRHAADRGVQRVMGRAPVQAIVAVGLANDKAKPLLWCRDELNVHVRLLEESPLVAAIVTGVELAEQVASKAVRFALKRVALEALSSGSDRVQPLSDSMWEHGSYWADLERAFARYAIDIGVDEVESGLAWREAIRTAARDHFRKATSSIRTDSRGLRAVAIGESELQRSLAQLLLTPEVA